MSESDEYDVPPVRYSAEIPPSLPPKKSSLRSSVSDIDGLSRTSADPRPRPLPRKTVRTSSFELDLSDSVTSSPEPAEPQAIRPVPRPRPRRNSQKILPQTESQLEDNLPPSADEVEKMLDDMVQRGMMLKEEEQMKMNQQLPLQDDALSSGQSESVDGVVSDSWTDAQLSSTSGAVLNREDQAGGGDSDKVFQKKGINYNTNSSLIRAESIGRSCEHSDDKPQSAFETAGTFESYAMVRKGKEMASDCESAPSVNSKTKPSPPPPLQSLMLQPVRVWNDATALKTSSNIGGIIVDEDSKGTVSEQSNQQQDSDEYEALWPIRQKVQEKPEMVRPISDLMVFTPKVKAESGNTTVSGERTGEYVELDPTYNIPPPSLPPPPLPEQAAVRSRPPSIPPRPQYKNPPIPQKSITLQHSSHLTETSTEGSMAGGQSTTAVFEGLPTPGFSSSLFHDDDPFKYSDFGTECQKFNTPLGKEEEGQIYEIGDEPADFVTEWPPHTGEAENTYNEIPQYAGFTPSRDYSPRLSQVPPPPPRSRRESKAEDSEARKERAPHRSHVYSLAHDDAQKELSESISSSDSCESVDSSDICRRNAGPICIVRSPPTRRNERFGYMYKQGGVKANRGWRLRWVVFSGKDLRYYDSNRSQISKKIIPLASMKEVISDIKESDTTRFKFRLVTTLRNRTFLFATDTRDDCCTWTSTLMAAILEKDSQPESDQDLSKPDKEGFIHFDKNNKNFYVAVWGKTLCYYDSFDDFQMHCPVHEIDMKLASVKDKKKNRLQLSTHYAHFLLTFDSVQEAQSWRMAMEDAIAEGLADDSVLEKVYENESNHVCADCGDEKPHWASINLGIVLCKKCAGVHRMFDSSISKIRSLRMDTRVWTPSLIELMKAVGNGNGNLFWEHDLLPVQKLSRDSLPEQRKQFAQLKYQKRFYSSQHPQAHDRKMLNETLLHVTAVGDLLEAMRIIFSGADLSYTGGPDKENAYQTAKRHGQRLLMELLYQNGGDCSCSDEENANDEGRLREDVRLQGHLKKTGPASRTFDDRWCVLEHGALTYYLNEKSTTAKDSIDRKNILCLQEVMSERTDSVFEVSTSKASNRVYTFAADSPTERGMWMRTLSKLIAPVAVMEHVGMMDFSLAALVFMRESVSEDWRSTWLMVSWRLMNYMNKDLKLDHVDLRKATHIRMQGAESGSCTLCVEKGACFVLSCPGQTFYIQANLQRDTTRIFDSISTAMKMSGKSLLDQQLTADNVPVIVDRCLKQVDSRGLFEEGIYRKAATNSKVVKLVQDLKADPLAVRLEDLDIHEVANAVKRFLRELDDSLFMRERYSEWIRTSVIEDHKNKFLWYRYLLEKLPLVNYSTLRCIVMHISKMAAHGTRTKMSVEGLCTCFAPTLMRTENDLSSANSPGEEIKVLLDLVSQRSYLFQIEKKEIEQEDRIREATEKILEAQQDRCKSAAPSSVLMPVSMYSHSGQCEMVNTTPATTARNVVDYLSRKCNLPARSYSLAEVLFKGCLVDKLLQGMADQQVTILEIVRCQKVRPMFPNDNILWTTGRWSEWEETARKEACLCLTDTDILEKLHKYHDSSRPLFGELKYADSKSKNKFRKTTVEFKQCVLAFYKDSKAKNQLCSWKVEELTIYLGIETKRVPASNSFGFTFLVNSREEKSKSGCLGHCVCLSSEEEMYRWVSALLVAQNPEGLLIWNR